MCRQPPGRTVQISRIFSLLALCSAACLAEESGGSGTVRSSLDLEIYGYLKLDAAYDTDRTSTGDFVRWVELAEANENDDAFNMTANQSRIGLRIGDKGAPSTEVPARVQTSGRVEVDFYGGGAANKSRLMLRHAYVKVLWPESGLELLAGQTSDLISPLVPATLNYSVAWWGGNIGYRRPQLRLTRRIETGSEGSVDLAVALARTIGATDSEFTSNDAGADSGVPSVQTRVAWNLATGSAYGLSGHWGREEFDRSAAGDSVAFDSWSLNVDFKQRLSSRVVLLAEGFTGANLQTYLGGIGQGVNLARELEIGASGGWLSFDLGPFESWSYHLGASVDDVSDGDIEAGARSRNQSLFVSGVYALADHLQMGVELSRWATQYQDAAEATALRGQFSLIYRF